jgi:hypothetical protein
MQRTFNFEAKKEKMGYYYALECMYQSMWIIDNK